MSSIKKGIEMKMQKRQFRIGELASHLGVERFVVRFWEKEFGLKPTRSQGGQRFYEEKDVEKFIHIKDLLYAQGFTISGAKKALKESSIPITLAQKTTMEPQKEIDIQPAKLPQALIVQLHELKIQLLKIREIL
jgi:DNA-binding transcriptional MerR regulator